MFEYVVTLECRDWWDALFPDASPAGFLLRQAYRRRWLRIHSLPESKRYADTETEYAEILARHNAVATDVLGQGSGCYLIEGSWIAPEKDAEGWRTHPSGYEQGLQFKVSDIVWKSNQHDELLRDIADWKRTNMVFASRETRCIYAPYDGGADLILRDEQERAEREQTYRVWLSEHIEGL